MKIIFKIFKWIITAFLFVVLAIVVFQKFTNNRVALGNIYIFQVVSESMLPEYRVGDIIVVKKTTADKLKIGDDVTYLGSVSNFDGLTITHRIIDIREENGKRYFTTKGMSNFIEDPEISEDNIYGKVIYHTVLFSFVGRLMTNMIVYYVLFVSVGVSFSYELITSFFFKKDDEEDDDDGGDTLSKDEEPELDNNIYTNDVEINEKEKNDEVIIEEDIIEEVDSDDGDETEGEQTEN